MKIHKAFKYRIYPNEQQVARLTAWNGALRFLWNLANEQRRLGLARPKDERKYPTAFDQINELTELRASLPWLDDVPRDVGAQMLFDLDEAWQRCFKKLAGAPKWKRRYHDFTGFRSPDAKKWRLKGNILRFPKLGNLRAVVHRPLEGKPKSCTLKRDGDHWFASILCEIEIADPVARTTPVVALDRGVVNVVADSDGNIVESPCYYEMSLKQLARAQHQVARKQKGSQNQKKAKVRVMRLHRKVRRQREYFLHCLSSQYSKSHGIVVVEKLQIANMVRVGGGLSRGMLDAGLGSLVHKLKYKMVWSGGQVPEVPAYYSSQTCSVCGCVDAKSRRSQSQFLCTTCGHAENADTNAAKVLLCRANRSVLLGEGSVPETALGTKKRIRVSRRHPKSITSVVG